MAGAMVALGALLSFSAAFLAIGVGRVMGLKRS